MSTEFSRREADLLMLPQNLGVDESIPWNHSLLACLLPGEPLQPPPLTQRHTDPWTAGGPGTEGRALRLMPHPPRAHVCMHCKPYTLSHGLMSRSMCNLHCWLVPHTSDVVRTRMRYGILVSVMVHLKHPSYSSLDQTLHAIA